jgi:prolyl 4-hydroxylase
MVQTVTSELKRWIIEQARSGCSAESVLQAMRDAGWEEGVALDALEATLREHLGVGAEAGDAAQLSQAAQLAAVAERVSGAGSGRPARRALPEPSLSGSPRQIDAGDRMVDVVVSLSSPRLVVFGNLLSDEECDALVAAARPRLSRSLTVQTDTGGEEMNADRTSQGMFFRRGEMEVVSRVEARLARLLNWPVENGEGLQVLCYKPGAEYKPHYDYFDPGEAGTPNIVKRGGQRLATIVMYLNEPRRGGGTTFPDIGLEVAPQRGHAVFFSYDRPHPATRTLHGGAPVIEGEKWVATKWLREREFS